MRIDGEKELVLLSFMQGFLRHLRGDISRKQVRPGKSIDVSLLSNLNKHLSKQILKLIVNSCESLAISKINKLLAKFSRNPKFVTYIPEIDQLFQF